MANRIGTVYNKIVAKTFITYKVKEKNSFVLVIQKLELRSNIKYRILATHKVSGKDSAIGFLFVIESLSKYAVIMAG